MTCRVVGGVRHREEQPPPGTGTGVARKAPRHRCGRQAGPLGAHWACRPALHLPRPPPAATPPPTSSFSGSVSTSSFMRRSRMGRSSSCTGGQGGGREQARRWLVMWACAQQGSRLLYTKPSAMKRAPGRRCPAQDPTCSALTCAGVMPAPSSPNSSKKPSSSAGRQTPRLSTGAARACAHGPVSWLHEKPACQGACGSPCCARPAAPTIKALRVEQVEDAKQLAHVVLHRCACRAARGGG